MEGEREGRKEERERKGESRGKERGREGGRRERKKSGSQFIASKTYHADVTNHNCFFSHSICLYTQPDTYTGTHRLQY